MQVLQARLIQHWHQKRSQAGWTIVDLLVLLVLFGILATLSLPAFSTQAEIAQQAEARARVRLMNRTQQAYFLERNTFASTWRDLGLGLPAKTQHYTYLISGGGSRATTVTNHALPELGGRSPWKAYIGGVQMEMFRTNRLITLSVLCEAAKAPSTGGPSGTQKPVFSATEGPACPIGYRNINRDRT